MRILLNYSFAIAIAIFICFLSTKNVITIYIKTTSSIIELYKQYTTDVRRFVKSIEIQQIRTFNIFKKVLSQTSFIVN